MKLIHTAKHAMEAHVIKGFLDSHGIEAVVRGEYLTSGWGELPVDLCSVWITDDAQFAHADRLLVAFLKGTLAGESGAQSWQCPDCNELLEGQFSACWNCGARRPEAQR
jgi:hypothetical protein